MNKLVFLSMVTVLAASVVGLSKICTPQPAFDEGKAVIVALGEVHHPASLGNRGCDHALDSFVVQELEALRWAVNLINSNNFTSGVTLGLSMLDTCGNPSLAVQGTLTLTPSFYLREYTDCTPVNNSDAFIGVLGPTRSSSAAAVSGVLDGRHIPQIAYSTTAETLGDKTKYPDFFRTVHSDKEQSKVMFAIVRELGWKYIVTVSSDDNYGIEGMKEFRRLAKADGICIGLSEVIADNNNDPLVLRDIFDKLVLESRHTDGPLGVVYFGPSPIAKGLIKEQHRRGLKNIYWVMPDAVGGASHLFGDQASTAVGILSIAPAHIAIGSFLEDHWRPLLRNISKVSAYPDNVHTRWLQECFMKMFSCKFPNMPSSLVPDINARFCGSVPENEIAQKTLHQSPYLVQALHALYAYALALKNWRIFQTPSGTLSARELLREIPKVIVDYATLGFAAPRELRQSRIRFEFSGTGDFNVLNGLTTMFNIYNFKDDGSFKSVGNYGLNGLSLDKDSIVMDNNYGSLVSGVHLPVPSCKRDCQRCKKVSDVPFIYIPGDLLIVGLFSVHDQGKKPFECGDYRSLTGSAQLVEAFMFALEANNASGSNFGAIVFDDCYNPLVATKTLLNFLSGDLKLTDPVSGIAIDAAKAIAVIGAFSSSVTISIADFLTPLRIPLISYGSASTILDDRYRFPFFLRTVSNLDQQAEAMVALLKQFGWNYVITLNSKNAYGRNGYELFKKHADKNGICIARSNELSHEFGNADAKLQSIHTAINDILPYASKARVVILIADDIHAKNVLLTIEERNKNLPRPLGFIFIGSEAWGRSSKVIKGVGEVAVGHITVGIYPQRDYHFERYFINKRPSLSHRNFWFNLYWQDHFHCDIEGTFDHKYGVPCRPSMNYNDPGRSFEPDPWAAYTVLAVNATIRGFRQTMRTHCNSRSDTACLVELKKLDKVETLVQNIQKTELLDANGNIVRPFNDDGNGNAGFSIYNIQRDPVTPQNLEYKKIGTYQDLLVLDRDKIILPDGEPAQGGESSCSRCLECPDISTNVEPGDSGHSKQEVDAKAVGLIVLGVALILFIGAVGFIFRHMWKKHQQVQKHQQNGYNKDRPLPQTPEEEDRRIYTVLPESRETVPSVLRHPSSQCSRCDQRSPHDSDRDIPSTLDSGRGNSSTLDSGRDILPTVGSNGQISLSVSTSPIVNSASYLNVHKNDQEPEDQGTYNISFENDSDGESSLRNVFV
ncbi:uncharacterized protein LOC106158345 [Lingula anatina]|uniref:Uncharacterized protein LOC106158345 n=1 Tax=Lingula anatina TaxID=7574 RepID=A0A1S3HXD1_LINAN|nr:uncharacterized protein LOC106158345 [Lingula anatina]|eukprot:XP_013389729.2 uncharacterized protein LOC106158345 [Lingula anatina]